MCPTNGNGQIAGNNLPAKLTTNATNCIADPSANQASLPNQPDDGLPLRSTNLPTLNWTEFSGLRHDANVLFVRKLEHAGGSK
jgi:hypothetical protein